MSLGMAEKSISETGRAVRRAVLHDRDVELPAVDERLDEDRLLVVVEAAPDLPPQRLLVPDDGFGVDAQAGVLGVGLDDEREPQLEGLVPRQHELGRRRRQPGRPQHGLGLELVLAESQGLGRVPGERQAQELEDPGDVGFPLRPPVVALAEVDQGVGVDLPDPAQEIEQALLERDERRADPEARTASWACWAMSATDSSDRRSPVAVGLGS